MTEHNINLRPYNTFALDAVAKTLIHISSEEDLETLPCGKDMIVLGGGSNTLFTKTIIEQPVVRIENRGIKVVDEDAKSVIVEAAAGENWAKFVLHCAKNHWSGIENLAAIYGSVGAAPVQNIGAYGVEVKDFIVSVLAYDVSAKQWLTFSNQDCDFAYRYSVFKYGNKDKIIWKVRLRLQKQFSPNLSYDAIRRAFESKGYKDVSPTDMCDLVTEIRNSKLPDPALLPNVGSFFKNPLISQQQFADLQALYPDIVHFKADNRAMEKLSAAWLIEKSGWKAKKLGTVAMHEKQSLVMVAIEPAKGEDILALAAAIRDDVKTKFDVDLQIEAHII
ncbi:MAG: UDP-N-acetylmuramate dehydrogenase [Bacteroidales bacterium]|jgi:UDP-N-acetylmuramate dehydrogenase|nr:UDP-N-acetylmuramate dehydrogenase [Bacteroidales bacterium]